MSHQALFTAERLERIRQMEAWHFWFVSRREWLVDVFGRHLQAGAAVFDLGCGAGGNLDLLRTLGFQPLGIDLRIEGLIGRSRVIRAQAESLPFASASLDACVALDLLEHVDDVVALREIGRALRQDGVLIATLPAHRWLWSHRDEAAGHRRRYESATVRTLMQQEGFAILEMRPFQRLLFPILVLSRFAGRGDASTREMEDAPPRWLNRVFLAVNRLDLAIARFLPRGVGSSLFVVARKVRG